METGDIVKVLVSIVGSCSGIFLNCVIMASRLQKDSEERCLMDLMHFVLGLTNIIIQSLQVSMDILLIFFSFLFFNASFQLFCTYAFLEASRFFIACMTAWLCSFYCIKIISFQHPVITSLKSRILAWLPWLISGSSVLSVGLMVLYIGFYDMFYPLNDTKKTNVTIPVENATDLFIFRLYMKALTSAVFLPFFIILVSLVFTLASLTRHIWRMQNLSNLDASHLRAHVKAAKTMGLLLLQNILFCVAHTTLTWEERCYSSGWCWLCLIVNYSSCPLQALILIQGDKKLYYTWKTLCFPSRQKSTVTEEDSNIQRAPNQKTNTGR